MRRVKMGFTGWKNLIGTPGHVRYLENGKERMRLLFRNGNYVIKNGPRGLESTLMAKSFDEAKRESMAIMFGV